MGSRTIRKHKKDEPAPYDYYETPSWTTSAIVPFLPSAANVCDPCAGRGAILRVLQHGYKPERHMLGVELPPPKFYGFEIQQDLVSFEPGRKSVV